ncbi:MAG TPA: hypothetical protein ENO00_02755 [Deltaproteobacteria bacterium]|nr:hypothetical protein [Deltaproteobacteria bacterium]
MGAVDGNGASIEGKSLILLFNHRLTRKQEEAALQTLNVTRIAEPPADLALIWREVPPELKEIHGYLEPIRRWLRSEARLGDYVLIQGDFGATYLMVTYAIENGYIPIYSTTYRMAVEEDERDDSIKVTHNFQHRIFRKYAR